MKRMQDRSCGEDSFGMDQACLQILTSATSDLNFFAQSSECIGCDFFKISDEAKNGSAFVVNATYETLIKIAPSNLNEWTGCNLSYSFVDDGVYQLDVEKCIVSVVKDPSNPNLPILFAFLFLVFTQIMWAILNATYHSRHCRRRLIKYYMDWRSQALGAGDAPLINQDFADDIMQNEDVDARNNSIVSQSAARGADVEKKTSRRVKSLDAFRGLSVAMMVFVNYGGGGYYFFNHSPWNGITVADLIFPWFMWIMGVSMPISIQSQLRNGSSRKRIAIRVIKRSVTLFALGLVVNSIGGNNDFRTFRIPGVLQRFGVSYLITGIVLAASLPREIPIPDIQNLWRSFLSSIRDVLICGYQWMLVVVLVAVHTSLTFALKVPGCPTGYLGPGGLHDGGKFSNCTGGAAGYIDRLVFGDSHIYNWPTAKQIYNTNVPYDPEGLLGCLTSAVIVCLGVQAGVTLLTFQDWCARVKRWIFWFVVLGAIGGGLCGFSKEDGVIPINKNLWSLSFIFALAGMAFLLLTAMYLLIDVADFWSGTPLIYVGMNPILVYMGHEICEDMFPFSWIPYTSSHYERLTMNLWGMSLWIFIAFILFKKKIFLAV